LLSIPHFRPLLQELADSLFAIVFPTQCSVCGGEVASAGGLGVCRECWSGVESWEGISCDRCGLPIVSEHAADAAQVLCGTCRASGPSFDLARTFGIYRGNLRLLILQLKFRRRERLGRRLGALLTHPWGKLGGLVDGEPFLIVPVPLFHLRERERGYNQARLLAEGLKHDLDRTLAAKKMKIDPGLLVRKRATLPQAGLKLQARKENVRNAFEVVKPELVAGRQVILVDDVMTTGATLSACAAVLKKRGAARVYALAMARATPQFPDTEDSPHLTGVDEVGSDWT
jgi:ComF family protein